MRQEDASKACLSRFAYSVSLVKADSDILCQ